MYTNKQLEIQIGEQKEQETLGIFYNCYVLNGQLFTDINQKPVSIYFQRLDPFADMDYAICEATTAGILGYVETKDRYISSEDFGDMVCPKRKGDFAETVVVPCYMVQRYTDGTYVLDLKQVQPFAVQPLQRKDWLVRGDREVILHNFYQIKQAKRIL